MQYVGIDRQIRKNNFNSLLLLITFPVLLLGMCYAFVYLAADKQNEDPQALFLRIFPFVLIAVGIWFFIAWMGNAAMIRMATGSKPLERRNNKRV